MAHLPAQWARLALTVWQPYASLLVTGLGGKCVENREWRPHAHELRPGETFFIHAGVKYERGAWAHVLNMRAKLQPLWQWFAVREPPFALYAVKPSPDQIEGATPYGAIIGRVTLEAVALEGRDHDPWWEGPFGWYVYNPVPCEPVFYPGAKQLWEPSPSVLRRANELCDAREQREVDAQNQTLRDGRIACRACGAIVESRGFGPRNVVRLVCPKGCATPTSGDLAQNLLKPKMDRPRPKMD